MIGEAAPAIPDRPSITRKGHLARRKSSSSSMTKPAADARAPPQTSPVQDRQLPKPPSVDDECLYELIDAPPRKKSLPPPIMAKVTQSVQPTCPTTRSRPRPSRPPRSPAVRRRPCCPRCAVWLLVRRDDAMQPATTPEPHPRASMVVVPAEVGRGTHVGACV